MNELLSRNRRAVLSRLERAAEDAGRSPSDVHLLCVTKSVDVATARALFELGEREFAENRLPGLEEKTAAFAARGDEARWHFVGHVQRNKARKVARLAQVIHSVDTLELVDTLGRVCAEESWSREIFLQVKLSDEEAKHGLAASEVEAALARAADHPRLAVRGLMTMAPRVADEAQRLAAARDVFRGLRLLGQTLDPSRFTAAGPELSMGMSADCEVAVQEGAHWVRVGTALFERDPSAAAGGLA